MTEHVGGENRVPPVGVADADLLEEPAGVGSVPVGHVHGGLHGLVQRYKRLREEFPVWGLEVGLGVADALGGVVFLRRGVSPEVCRRHDLIAGGGGSLVGTTESGGENES